MPDQFKGEKVAIIETARIVDRDNVNQRVNLLAQKYNLNGCLGDLNRVVEKSCEIIDKYQLPETFLKDEINLGLLVGCSQKLTENHEPLYRQRVENFVDCLVQPLAAIGTNKIEQNWGGSSSGALKDGESVDYARKHIEPEMSEALRKKIAPNIEECIVVWGLRGYDLDIEVIVVDENKYEFKKQTGSAGFINVPDNKEMLSAEGIKMVKIVLPKDSVLDEDILAHELYHIRDRFDMVRRGYGGRIFENIDELHTEYSVGNYGSNDERQEKNMSAYFTLKEFWHKIVRSSTLKTEMLADRDQLFTTMIKEFGFEGLVDFALLSAHSSGNMAQFETMYKHSERALVAMMIAREKIQLRRDRDNVDFDRLEKNLETIQKWLSPQEKSFRPHYRKYFDLFPNVYSKERVYLNYSEEETSADFTEVRDVVLDYPKALAYFELQSTGELDKQDGDEKILNLLGEVPYKREKLDYDPETEIKPYLSKDKEVDEEDKLDGIIDMYANLFYNLEGIDFIFGLVNEQTRGQILWQFFEQLDQPIKFCLDSGNPKFMQTFVKGIYGYNTPWELREYVASYVKETYPQLAEFVDETRNKFVSKNTRNTAY